jgi:hypothetical protein
LLARCRHIVRDHNRANDTPGGVVYGGGQILDDDFGTIFSNQNARGAETYCFVFYDRPYGRT